MNTALLTANLLVCLTLAISGTFATAPDPTECPEGWTNNLFQCYYFSNETATWTQAWDKCANFRAHVVSLETESEVSKLKSFLKKHNVGTNNYWTSGSNDNDVGHWAWYGTLSPIVYFDTCQDDSVLASVNENGRCLSLSIACGYQWIPEDCSNKTLKYICEKHADLPPLN